MIRCSECEQVLGQDEPYLTSDGYESHYPKCPEEEEPTQNKYQVTISMVRVYEITATDEVEAESKATKSAYRDYGDEFSRFADYEVLEID